MMEEIDERKVLSKQETFAVVALGSQMVSPDQLKMSKMSKKCQNMQLLPEYSHILCKATIPTLVLTDDRSLTRFFQTKKPPPALWNACDYVLQFTFRKMQVIHVAGSQNTAANSLARIKLIQKKEKFN